jgi:hypothetical protein
MSFSAAVTTGSGIGIEAVSFAEGCAARRLTGCAVKRSKFGKEKFGKEKATRSKFGREKAKRSKFGMEKPLNFGNENWWKIDEKFAMAAPVTARAANDTTIAGTRLEAPRGAASGCLSPWVSFSGVSVTCVPYVSACSQNSPAADQ